MTRNWLFLLLFCLLRPLAAAPIKLDPDLELEQPWPHVFLQRSWMQVEGFGRVECNGLVYVVEGKALVIDTPGSAALCEKLLDWLESQRLEVCGVVVGHTHQDSMGGLEVFQRRGLPSYASFATIELARKQGKPVPSIGFDQQLSIAVGSRTVRCLYPGRGHSFDNVVTYLPAERVLFGGCLLKAQGAGKGYLGDADVVAWPTTVATVRQAFADAQFVVPGHGRWGGLELLDYTIKMFSQP
ncbi:MAG: subclass B1 metallo-beta-lactamase [Candidatus Eremiobacteraeota bacterium]|nr:subclass B1 metallo-beta-lactamase [Candidatus Eremiobacteraeota bacterium]